MSGVAFRDKVAVTSDDAIRKGQARMWLAPAYGEEMFVEHAHGCLQRPLSDSDLEAKFHSVAATELAPRAIGQLIGQCRSLASLPDAGIIARARVAAALH